MGRSPCCDQNGLKKGPWTPEEDTKLTHYIRAHGPGNWRTLPKNAGLDRCGKSCRLRWTNYLRPDIKRGRFSFDEEEAIIQLHSVLGNKWSAIASRLPGRTDNEIKNYWNTHVRKRLLRTGIDPVTHAPRLDFPDLSSLINLVQLQTLLNPETLRLAMSLVEMNNNYQIQIQPNQFGNLIPFLHENDNHQLVGATGDLRREVDTTNDYGVINQGQMTRVELSENNSSFQSLNASSAQNSVLSTPLDSVVVGEDEMDSFCSGLLKFEIPEGLNFDEFIM